MSYLGFVSASFEGLVIYNLSQLLLHLTFPNEYLSFRVGEKVFVVS